MRPDTAAIHTVVPLPETGETPITPIYQASTFALEGLESDPAYMYTRYQNPNRAQLEATIAALEGARFGHCYASGMAAIHAAFGTLRAGDHILAASDLYGGTMNLIRAILAPAGIECSLFDPMTPGSLTENARPNTRIAVYESPTNPTLKVCDIASVAAEARARGIRTVFDNTFASPALQNPLALGVDVVVHSSTKYIGGHSDITGGALLTNDESISADAFSWLINSGASPSPFECWLTHRGVKTLGLRVAKHCSNAQQVAEFLVKHPRVVRVNYPGLPGHGGHEIAQRQMRGFGGMMSVVFDRVETAQRIVGTLKVWTFAPSLGGVESLIGYPARMSHAGLTPQERATIGIPDSLLRLSVGIEDPADLIEDLDQGLR